MIGHSIWMLLLTIGCSQRSTDLVMVVMLLIILMVMCRTSKCGEQLKTTGNIFETEYEQTTQRLKHDDDVIIILINKKLENFNMRIRC